MSEFTHVRCGGNLVPIPRPAWATSDDYARCDRCNLPGIIGITGPGALLTLTQAEAVRRRIQNGDRRDALAHEYGVSPSVIQAIYERRAYRSVSQ